MPSYQWDDTLEDNGEGDYTFILLPPGIYGAECVEVTRGFSTASNCNQAGVVWKVVSTKGRTKLTDYLNLSENVKWKILQLFRSVGMRKHGEAIRLNFPALPGKTGWLKIGHRTYLDKNNVEKTTNQIEGYIPPEEVPVDVHADYKQASGTSPVPEQGLPF